MIWWLGCTDLPARPLVPPPPPLAPIAARNTPGAPLDPDGPTLGSADPSLACVDVTPGLGPTAAREGSVVVLDYTTWALGPDPRERVVVDTTYDRPGPYRFLVGSGRMISGIDEGVRGLRAGAVRQLHLGPRSGFGDYGMPERVPPGSDLVVDLEVLAVLDPPAQPAAVEYAAVDGVERADLVPGAGPAATDASWVTFDWIVWTEGGTALDSSFGRADPYVLDVGASRLAAALRGVRAGGVRQLRIRSVGGLPSRRIAPGAPFDEPGEAPALPADAPVVAQVVVHAVTPHDNPAAPQ